MIGVLNFLEMADNHRPYPGGDRRDLRYHRRNPVPDQPLGGY